MAPESQLFSPDDKCAAPITDEARQEALKPVELMAGQYNRIGQDYIIDGMKDDMFVGIRDDIFPNLTITPEIRDRFFDIVDESLKKQRARFDKFMKGFHSNVAEAEATILVFKPNPPLKPPVE